MSYLVDTNILLRMRQPNHAMHLRASQTVKRLIAEREKLYIASQNLIEFWNVATRPKAKNGLGMSPEIVRAQVTDIQKTLPLKPDLPAVHQEWLRLVTHYNVKGVNVHDARLVAFAIVHDMSYILTFNVKDFNRYSEISAIAPDETP